MPMPILSDSCSLLLLAVTIAMYVPPLQRFLFGARIDIDFY